MTFTKKHFAGVALLLTAVLVVIFYLYLPVEIAGHVTGNIPLRLFHAGFFAVTVSALVVSALVVLTRGEYVRLQIITFARFRHLLVLLVKRDFVARYRRSVLGILWSLLNPLLTMLVMTMVFSTIFSSGIENFPVYFLSGQMIFLFFSESTTLAMGSITGAAGTIKKVYVPKYIFPISRVLSSLVNIGFSFIALMLIMLITGAPFQVTTLLVFIPIFYVVIFSMGVGMMLSSLAVFFKDITHLYGVVTQLLFFMTPIMYPVEILPERIYFLIHLNPMFHFVTYFRELVMFGNIPGFWLNIICSGFAVAAFGAGLYVKMSQQDKYILHL
ncbi:MAG: ABC transporter permease [Defluviitaleaceae bacterium]|nr:ABC transporter permease [Defluviitaleaceae bacterium]